MTPPLPVRFTTKLGVAFAIVTAVVGAVLPLLDADQRPTSVAFVVAALGAIYKVLDGRYAQARTVATVQAQPLTSNAGHVQTVVRLDDSIAKAGVAVDQYADDEPGDPDGLADVKPTAPSQVPQDQGDDQGASL